MNSTVEKIQTGSHQTPLVSIFVPVYNGELFLGATLESLLGQTFCDFQIIIVDDGSEDGTLALARQFSERDNRISVVRHDRNFGLSAARNTGWQSAAPDSKYLMNHDSDDISLPKKLETLVRYLEEHTEIAAVGSFCKYIDGNGEISGHVPMEWRPRVIRATLGGINSMAISATLVRRDVYEKIGGFDDEYGGCDDYEFWTRAIVAGYRLANIPKVLHLIRIHPGSMGATRSAEMQKQTFKIGAMYDEKNKADGLSRCLRVIYLKTLRLRSRLRGWISYLFEEVEAR